MRTENEVPKEQVDLGKVIEKEVELFQQHSRDRHISLEFENRAGSVTLQANRFSMEQLFNNLLSNALRYTPEGGSVSVLLDTSDRKDVVEARIRDSGIGIAPENVPHIFDDFYRASNVQHGGAEGTGLGLALVRRHCLSMGGTVEMKSALGSGSTFRMVFPLVEPGDPSADRK